MDDDETWLSPGLSSTTKSSTKGTQSDLDSWLNTTSSSIDFSTRSALSRKLKGLTEKKARRRQLRSLSTVSLESVSEESPHKKSIEQEGSLPLADDVDTTLLPLAHSSPRDGTTVAGSMDRGRSFDLDSVGSPFGYEEEEYEKLEEAALGLSLQSEGGGEVQGKAQTILDEEEDEFLSAASEFEDEELEAAHHNGRSRELESLDEEPARSARQQMGSGRLGVTARSSSVSPRLAAIVLSGNKSTPKGVAGRVEGVSTEISSTPVGTMTTLPRRLPSHNNKGGMSVSLHMPSGHLPPRRIPPGRENGKSTVGGGGGKGKETEKKVNLHEDLAKIQDVAREQEEALRREVMGSLSANDVSNGENDSHVITNSKSVDLIGKKEFHSRLPTPSRRVIPVRGRPSTGILPLRAAPNSVGTIGTGMGGSPSISQSGPTTGQNGQSEDDCF